MKTYLLLIVLLIVSGVKAQSPSKKITPIKSGEFVITSLNRDDKLLLELAHPDFFYRDTDTIRVFGPDGRTGFITKDCFGSMCTQANTVENNLAVPGNTISDDSEFPETPLRVKLIKRPRTGIYTVSVVKKGEVHHKRTFSIVDPKPGVDSVLITGFDGVLLKNTLRIDKIESLGNIKIRLLGTNVTTGFESVTIQGLTLRKHPSEIATYILDDTWTKESISKMNLGKTQIAIKRKFSDEITRHEINLEADVPVINKPGLKFSADVNENKTKVTLNVQHVFPGAKLILENHPNHPDFLLNTGEIEPDVVTAASGIISGDIYFNSDLLINSANFIIKVKNKDGKTSKPEVVTIDRSAKNVSAQAFDDNLPLVSGIKNQILFENLGGDPFQLDADLSFKFIVVGGDTQNISARKETENTFSAELDLPEDIYDLTFVISKSNGSNWSGSINNILAKPVLTVPQQSIFRGGNLKAYAQNAAGTNIQHIDRSISISEANSGTAKTFDIVVDKESRLSEFDLVLKLKNHELGRKKITIANWPEPVKDDLGINSEAGKKENDRFVMSESGDIQLSFDAEKDSLQRFTVQLIKNDGTRLGVAKPMILDTRDKKIKATVSTKQVGIQHGETFSIEIANPAGEFLLYPGYVQRTGREKWIITAGISVLNIPLDKDESRTSTSNILDGINVAGYYMFENAKNPSNRFLGIGPNVLIGEDEGDLNIAGAISLLIYEKLVVGLSYGKQGLGTLVGANIELANLANLLGSKD